MKSQVFYKYLMVSLLSVLAFFCFTTGSNGQGITDNKSIEEIYLMPGRIMAPPNIPDPITMKQYNITTSVQDNVATTTIEQSFFNKSNRTLEAKYIYPLPEDANFSSFTLTINGKPVEGKIMEKEEARNTYFKIVQRLIDPGLLEFIDQKTVQVSVAPIFAGEEKKIRLSYTQLLKQDGGFYKYQYPFGLKAGNHLSVEDASLNVNLKTSQPLKTVYSPTHSPLIDRKGNQEAKISINLKEQKSLLEKNFVLYFSADNKTVSLNSLVFKEPVVDQGYFLLTIKAPQELQTRTAIPKNIVLVIDTSGSMSGNKIIQAKEALKYIVNNLKKEDSFNIVQFNTDIMLFREEMMSANAENKKAALEYVENLNANGSTHIEGALKTSFKQLPVNTGNRPGYVIFLTDGEPTVGITDTPGLLKTSKEANNTGAKLFNFGVGYDVKTDLLEKLATSHHGSTTYVEPDENLELALTSFYNKIETPVLTDVNINFGQFKVSQVYPNDIGDLFAGSEVILLGRFANGGSGQITLSGKMGYETKQFHYPVSWKAQKATLHANLPRLWAGRRIGYLLDSINQNGESKEVKDEIVLLSKQYGIITPYTSFLALDPSEEYDTRDGGIPQPRPVPLSAAPMGSISGYRASKGKDAVKLQKSLNQMQMQASAAEMNEAQMAGALGNTIIGVKTVGQKTFAVSAEGIWIDTEYDKAKHGTPVKVTFGSPEYFQLISSKPDLARYLSIASKIIVIFEGKAYEVVLESSG